MACLILGVFNSWRIKFRFQKYVNRYQSLQTGQNSYPKFIRIIFFIRMRNTILNAYTKPMSMSFLHNMCFPNAKCDFFILLTCKARASNQLDIFKITHVSEAKYFKMRRNPFSALMVFRLYCYKI